MKLYKIIIKSLGFAGNAKGSSRLFVLGAILGFGAYLGMECYKVVQSYLLILLAVGGYLSALVCIIAALYNNYHNKPSFGPSRWERYLHELATASRSLFNFLVKLNHDERCQKLLNSLPGLEKFNIDENTFAIDPRLASLVYADITDSFRKSGHTFDEFNRLEGVGLSMILCQLLNRDFEVSRFYDRAACRMLTNHIEALCKESSFEINITGHENALRLAYVLGVLNDEHALAKRYTTLFRAWAALIAQADGVITPEEMNELNHLSSTSAQ